MKHLKLIFLFISSFIWLSPANAAVTVEECVEKARDHYPLIKRYGILDSLQDIDLSDINKNWLPKATAYGQLTGQNTVPSYPEALSNVLQQMGQTVKGLSKVQYKVGIDINQTLWDGGTSSVNRHMVKARDEVSRASMDVELYAIRERVENIYFSILLTEEQIEQSEATAELLEANLARLRVMFKNGTAMQSDCDMVEAQLLTLRQTIENVTTSEKGLRRILGLYIGEDMEDETLVLPGVQDVFHRESLRPELALFEKRKGMNLLADKLTETQIMPKVGFFAQAYYGYPGFNYFQSMMKRTLSFNILAGVKIQWNLDALYTKKNNLRRTSLNLENIANDRELFIFNSEIASEQQRYAIEGIKKSMEEDSRIVELRRNVRRAAESQLENGVIDATALLAKITDENVAILTAKLHRIQYIQELYKLKYILNR